MKSKFGAQLGRATPLAVGFMAAQMMCGLTAQAAENKDENDQTNGTLHLETVIITAEKVSSSEMDTPTSVTTVTGRDLERATAADVMRQAPNTYLTKAGQHSSVAFISMRGITPFMEAEQPVGFFVDGVHYRNIDADLLDVERVEVLRGPQSVLYGRNTEAGAINVITHDPTNVEEHLVSVDIGNHNRKVLTGITGGALWNEDWSYRATFQILRSDGYFTHEPDGIDDVDAADDINGRFKVRWHPKDTWDIIATYDGQYYQDGATNIATLDQIRSDPHKVTSNFIGYNDTDTHGGNVRTVYKAPSFTVTSISAYTNEDKSAAYDVDASAYDAMRLNLNVDYSRFTQELRMNSPESASGPRWLTGIYFFDQTEHNNFDMDMNGLGYGVQSVRTTTDTLNAALFGQVTWPVLEKFSVITGLRYDHERKDINNHQVWAGMGRDFNTREEMAFHAWLPKVGLEYKPITDLMAYTTYSKGYKAGGFNNLADPGEEDYDAEYTTNYEIGLKYSALNNQLQTKLAAFWIDWTNQQVEELVLTQSNITNAGESVSRGVELEVAWQASQNLLLKASSGWNDAHFVTYKDNGNDYSGNRPPNAPAFTYTLGFDYTFDNGIYARVDWAGSSGVYFDSANTKRQDHYGLLNMKAGYRTDGYEVAVWAKNALDEVYVSRAFDIGGGTYAGIAGEPRTFGVTLTTKW